MADPKTDRIVKHLWLVLLGLVGCWAVFHDNSGLPHHPGQSDSAGAKAGVCMVHEALDAYAADNGGRYPDSLQPLVTPDERGETYLNRIRDPWGRDYIYMREPLNVMTLGADGEPGGTGDDADIDYISFVNGG